MGLGVNSSLGALMPPNPLGVGVLVVSVGVWASSSSTVAAGDACAGRVGVTIDVARVMVGVSVAGLVPTGDDVGGAVPVTVASAGRGVSVAGGRVLVADEASGASGD